MTEPAPPLASFQAGLRLFAVLFLGFASGLPLALSGQAMQAWLTVEGLDIATIGFLGLVGIPYSFKFLWAPLMDRFDLPLLGRRRGWLVFTQLLLAATLLWMANVSPKDDLGLFAVMALLVAFVSASQDIVVDAYRTDVLPAHERGLGGSFAVFGYRVGMIVSGGIALIWAQQYGWGQVYSIMAGIMLVAAGVSLLLLPKVSSELKPLASAPRQELLGFAAMLLGFAGGWFAVQFLLLALGFDLDTKDKWLKLLLLLSQVFVALPAGYWMARKAGFETLNRSLDSYFSQTGAVAFMLLIVLYKLGDAFAGSLTTPFLIKGMGFTQAEVGIVIKIIGVWLTILGALLAGVLMLRWSLFKSLLVFGVLQLLSNLGFWVLAVQGKGAWGSFLLPAFDWWLVSVSTASEIDFLLMAVIAVENISGGMGTAAFTVLLMSLCNQRFTATHYALLSAFAALGRIYVSPLSGVLSESIGWPNFFLFSILMAVPGIVAVWWMRSAIHGVVNRT